MDKVLENILSRKSVRKFTPKKVTKDEIVTLLKAAMAAPCARNSQVWRFVVVDSAEILAKMAAKLPYARLETATTAIVVCADSTGYCKFWEQDCGAATENILLAAESMGLGCCWTAASDEERGAVVREALELPEEILPFCVIPVGHPDGDFKPKDKWKPENIHYNKW